MSKLGRKRKDKDEYKPAVISTRLKWEEYENLKDIVKKLGMTTSEYLRYLIINRKQPKINIERILNNCEELRRLSKEINVIGVNINQIARYTNRKREIDVAVLEKLTKIEEELNYLLYTFQKWIEESLDADTSSTE
jgi:transcriptional regulator with XRE-family HTH domain